MKIRGYHQKKKRIAAHIEQAIIELGMDLDDASIQDTPERFADYLLEFMQPISLEEILGNGFDKKDFDGIVIQSDIPFRMICEHHLLPAIGKASIGYIPNRKVVGLSKLTRLVQAVGTEKPNLQENISNRIAELLTEHIEPRGTIVVIQAEHACMTCRGINSPNVITTTSSVRGVFRDVAHARAEFFSLVQNAKEI